MKEDFDFLFNEHQGVGSFDSSYKNGAHWGFGAGQQSKQAEVDELNDKLKSIEISSKECLNAMSLSCSNYLNENKKLLKAIEDIKTYLAEAPNKHVSQTAMLKVLDILDILKGDRDEN